MNSLSVSELKSKIDAKEDIQVIDVRETHEVEICSIGGEHIPMAEIPARVEEVNTDKLVVIHCRSGKRSANVINYLEANYNLENLYNLEGGILAWAQEIDPDMSQY